MDENKHRMADGLAAPQWRSVYRIDTEPSRARNALRGTMKLAAWFACIAAWAIIAGPFHPPPLLSIVFGYVTAMVIIRA